MMRGIHEKVLFLISNERFPEFQKKASEERQKDRNKERMDRDLESKKPLDKRELEMLEANKSFQADL